MLVIKVCARARVWLVTGTLKPHMDCKSSPHQGRVGLGSLSLSPFGLGEPRPQTLGLRHGPRRATWLGLGADPASMPLGRAELDRGLGAGKLNSKPRAEPDSGFSQVKPSSRTRLRASRNQDGYCRTPDRSPALQAQDRSLNRTPVQNPSTGSRAGGLSRTGQNPRSRTEAEPRWGFGVGAGGPGWRGEEGGGAGWLLDVGLAPHADLEAAPR